MPDYLIEIAKVVLVALIAFMYAAVGHGGATGYIACLALFGMPQAAIATTALILNTIVASISLTQYARAGQLKLRLSWPFLLLSMPMAFVGARLPVDKHIFVVILGCALIAAALRFIFLPTLSESEQERRSVPVVAGIVIGALLGLLSGIIGIGGGVFLSPVIILCRWGDLRQTAATSALFIVANSISGLIGRYLDSRLDIAPAIDLLPLSVVAALAGAYLGARRFNSVALRRLLGIVLLMAACKLFMAGWYLQAAVE